MIIHEIAHGSVALHLGDQTAKLSGRLSLNPLKHLDPFGSIIMPFLMFVFTAGHGPIFGWAKPVPINPYNFRDQKWGTLKVAFAGPGINFLIALFFGLLIRFSVFPASVLDLFEIIVSYNLLLGLFNLIPVPPLDGSHILLRILPDTLWQFKVILKQAMPGIVTALLIGLGRGISDAAAVLFTAGYTDSLPSSLFRPVATLPLAIFFQLGTPFPEVQQRGYTAALVLIVIIFAISVFSRLLMKRFYQHILR